MMSHSWKINDSQRFKGTKHYPRPCHGFRYALHRASSLRARACQNVALANAGRRSLVALTGFAESCLEGRRIAALLTSTLPEPPHLSCSEKQHDPHPAKRPQGDCGFPSKLATSRPFPRAVGSGRRRAGCRPSGSPPFAFEWQEFTEIGKSRRISPAAFQESPDRWKCRIQTEAGQGAKSSDFGDFLPSEARAWAANDCVSPSKGLAPPSRRLRPVIAENAFAGASGLLLQGVCQRGSDDGQCDETQNGDSREGAAMELAQSALANTGDNPLPFIVGGIVVVALIVLVVAFVLMRRR